MFQVALMMNASQGAIKHVYVTAVPQIPKNITPSSTRPPFGRQASVAINDVCEHLRRGWPFWASSSSIGKGATSQSKT